MPKISFADKELHRHGWKEGKGLGKNENGMKSAIKVKLKNNKGGLGHDHGLDFSFHWWDHIFNKAASSLEVTKDENESIEIKKTKNKVKIIPTLISTKRPLQSTFAGKPLLYGTFVSAGTTDLNGKLSESEDDENSGSNLPDDESEDFSSKDLLERTFKETGLTGHKAARHGLKLNGKLKRIQDQESKAEKEVKKKRLKHNETSLKTEIFNEKKHDTSKKRKKKHKKRTNGNTP